MDGRSRRFFAPCPRGLEGAGTGTPRSRCAGHIQDRRRRWLHGPWSTMYWVNLKSHIASRVLWEVGHSPYQTEDDVYRAAYALPWHEWFAPSQTIKVKVSARRCPLPSLDFLTLRIKDAVCDKFVAMHQRRPSVDTDRPHIKLDAFLDQSTITFYLDTSGEPLFKRGYRIASVEAPLKENLAAGILRLAGWTPSDVFLDPMCGGTVALEAALMARRIPPGMARHFAFERLLIHDDKLWGRLREAALAKRLAEVPAAIYASDHDPAMVKIAQRAFQGAGVVVDVRFKQSDILDLEAPAEQGVMVINPPYGVRLSRPDELASLYPKLGDWLKQRFVGWRAYILTGDARVPKLIGLAPSERIPLFNGDLECRLYEFVIVPGGARRRLGTR